MKKKKYSHPSVEIFKVGSTHLMATSPGWTQDGDKWHKVLQEEYDEDDDSTFLDLD